MTALPNLKPYYNSLPALHSQAHVGVPANVLANLSTDLYFQRMLVYNYHIEFLTATILRWQHLLAGDEFKSIITESLGWLALQERCKIYGFVIMPNHVHLLWRINNKLARREVQGALLSFRAHLFKKLLEEVENRKLYNHFVGDADRKFQF